MSSDLAAKDDYELNYWVGTESLKHLKKYPMYLERWGYRYHRKVLDVGTGPYSGFLPFIEAEEKVGLDPLYPRYGEAGIFLRYPGIEYLPMRLEDLPTPGQFQKFNAVLCADCLDHGNLGFHMLPKLADLLQPAGKLFLHVHFRPPEKLNAAHDYPLDEWQLDEWLARTDLVEEKREILPNDIDGKWCAALMGVWRKS